MLNMLSSQVVSANLYRLADWLQSPGAQPKPRAIAPRIPAHIATFPASRAPATAITHFRGTRQTAIRRPLRVVRVLDAEQSRNNAGRIVISGCIADVCAELDRLAQD